MSFPISLLDRKRIPSVSSSPVVEHVPSGLPLQTGRANRVFKWRVAHSKAMTIYCVNAPVYASGHAALTLDMVKGIALTPAPSRWNRIYRQVAGLRALRHNWDTYGAPAPNYAAVVNLETLLQQAFAIGVTPSGVLASAEGGVLVVFNEQGRHANIECFNDGSIGVATREPLNVWPITPDEIPSTIGQIAAYLRG